MKGRTTFVIAHRLPTVRHATRILVFQNGRIIETGTFDELVKRGGHFAELVKAQFVTALDAVPVSQPGKMESLVPKDC
jgi:ABC-type multidrug transport system fused ATPase/permease subunit